MTTNLLDDMAEFLPNAAAPSLELTVGTNLFLGLMPNSPNACVALYEYSGGAPDYTFGAGDLPVVESPHLQVVVRDVAYQAGRTTIEIVVRALQSVVNQVINTTNYYRIEPLQSPFLMHRDAARRSFFVCNLVCLREPS